MVKSLLCPLTPSTLSLSTTLIGLGLKLLEISYVLSQRNYRLIFFFIHTSSSSVVLPPVSVPR